MDYSDISRLAQARYSPGCKVSTRPSRRAQLRVRVEPRRPHHENGRWQIPETRIHMHVGMGRLPGFDMSIHALGGSYRNPDYVMIGARCINAELCAQNQCQHIRTILSSYADIGSARKFQRLLQAVAPDSMSFI